MTTEQEMTIDGYRVDEMPLAAVDALNQRELQLLMRRAEEAEAKVIAITRDLTTVAEMLRDEAIGRDWCSDYGHFVDSVNSNTSAPWLKHCEFAYSAIFTVTVAFTSRSRSYTDATNEILQRFDELEIVDYGSINGVSARLDNCAERAVD